MRGRPCPDFILFCLEGDTHPTLRRRAMESEVVNYLWTIHSKQYSRTPTPVSCSIFINYQFFLFFFSFGKCPYLWGKCKICSRTLVCTFLPGSPILFEYFWHFITYAHKPYSFSFSRAYTSWMISTGVAWLMCSYFSYIFSFLLHWNFLHWKNFPVLVFNLLSSCSFQLSHQCPLKHCSASFCRSFCRIRSSSELWATFSLVFLILQQSYALLYIIWYWQCELFLHLGLSCFLMVRLEYESPQALVLLPPFFFRETSKKLS